MDCNVLTIPDALKSTYSGISKTLPLAVLLSLTTPSAIDANNLEIFNTQPIKYETKITSPIAYQITNIALWENQRPDEFKPKTEFVKKLLAFREQAILNGMKLLTANEILAEKHALRGEID